MINSMLGIKSKMMQAFTQTGARVAVTVVRVEPNIVTQIKKAGKEGHLQLGTGFKSLKNIKKPRLGHLKGAIKDNKIAPRFLREVKAPDGEYEVGQMIGASEIFKEGDLVQVRGVSKGKGFAGVVKRWGFSGGPKTHGQSDRWRAPGSIGQGTTPGRVLKGKKMAGHMGQDNVSVKNLTILKIDEKSNELLLSGPVPGSTGGLLRITKIGENKKFGGLYV